MKRIRLRFYLGDDHWHGSSAETLWSESYEDCSCVLDNIPFLAFGVSYGDIVNTKPSADGIRDFIDVRQKSGHSTYRLIIHGIDIPEARLKQLSDLGCLHEVGKFGQVLLIAVSVPPTVNIHKAYSKFEIGDSDGIWDFEESNFEHYS